MSPVSSVDRTGISAWFRIASCRVTSWKRHPAAFPGTRQDAASTMVPSLEPFRDFPNSFGPQPPRSAVHRLSHTPGALQASYPQASWSRPPGTARGAAPQGRPRGRFFHHGNFQAGIFRCRRKAAWGSPPTCRRRKSSRYRSCLCRVAAAELLLAMVGLLEPRRNRPANRQRREGGFAGRLRSCQSCLHPPRRGRSCPAWSCPPAPAAFSRGGATLRRAAIGPSTAPGGLTRRRNGLTRPAGAVC